jgi:glycosyltransferase involved in cell wall biosynthesis
MKVVFLAPGFQFPPRQGAAIRNLYWLEALAGRAAVWVVAPDLDLDEVARSGLPVKAVGGPAPRRSVADRLVDLLAGRADLAGRLWSPVLAAELYRVLHTDPPDLVHIGGLEMAPYLPVVRRGAPTARVVLDEYNAEYRLQWSAFQTGVLNPVGAVYSYIQARRLEKFEAGVLREVDLVWAVSEADRVALKQLAPEARIELLPNSVDTDYYAFEPLGQREPAFVFIGTMAYRPNRDAVRRLVRRVLPEVRRAVPDAELWLVGRGTEALAGTPGIRAWGEVADERPVLRRAAAMVVPVWMGGGTRFKVLVALALGLPVVATPLGVEGLGLKPDVEALVASDETGLAAGLVRLLRDRELAARIAVAGRRRVETCYDRRRVMVRAVEAYFDLVRPQ